MKNTACSGGREDSEEDAQDGERKDTQDNAGRTHREGEGGYKERFRSTKNVAVLRWQRTPPKNRRFLMSL